MPKFGGMRLCPQYGKALPYCGKLLPLYGKVLPYADGLVFLVPLV